MELSHTFTPAALAWIGGAFETVSAISPFRTLQADDFGQEDMEVLQEAGVIQNGGEITPEWYTALQKLANPDAYTRVRFRSGPLQADRVVYFAADDPSPVSLTTTAGGLTFDYPPMNHAFLEDIADFTGRSHVVNSDLEADLDYASARVLVTLIDRDRRHVLGCLAREEEPRARRHSAEEIAEEIQGETGSGQRLASILQGLRDRPADPGAGAIAEYLENLVARDLIVGENGGYRTAGDAQRLAGHLLVVDGIVQIDGGSITGDQSIEGMEAIFVLGGLHDILMIDPGAGSVTVQTISGTQLHTILRGFLGERPTPRQGSA